MEKEKIIERFQEIGYKALLKGAYIYFSKQLDDNRLLAFRYNYKDRQLSPKILKVNDNESIKSYTTQEVEIIEDLFKCDFS